MDTENFKIFINELADASGQFIAKSFGKSVSVDFKNDSSPVTEVDRNTELLLREMIQKKFPSHGIIGEEFGNVNENAEFVWVLDPIDGTKSFITKVPLFGTLIGLQYCGNPIVGLIDQPILKERIVGDLKEFTYYILQDIIIYTKKLSMLGIHRFEGSDSHVKERKGTSRNI